MKKNRQGKGFILGFIVAALIFNMVIPAVAATVKQARITYKDIKIQLDGKTITPKDTAGRVVDPFIMGGTTYLPIRAVGEALGLYVGWDNNTNTVILKSKIPDPTPTPAPADRFDANRVRAQLETSEYTYRWGSFRFQFLKVKNNSPYDIRLSVDATFYDAANKMIGVEHSTGVAFESGQEMLFTFTPDEDYSRVDYSLSPSQETSYDCVVSSLSYSAVEAKDKIVLSVTNNGSIPAEFVEAEVIFFKGSDVVGKTSSFFTDNDYELKPGATIHEELKCYEEFDSYLIFLTGRHSKW